MNNIDNPDHSITHIRFDTLEITVRNIFTNKTSSAGRFWLSIINVAIIISSIALAMSTHESFFQEYQNELSFIDRVSVFLFFIDYCGNLYFAENRKKYIFSFWGFIDLISILPTILQIYSFAFLKSLKIVQALRVLRILRILKLLRVITEQSKAKKVKNPILTNLKIYFTALFMIIMICSTLMYYVEGSLYSKEAIAEGQLNLDNQNRLTNLSSTTSQLNTKFVPTDPIDGSPIPEEKRFYTSIPVAMWWCVLAISGNSEMFPVTIAGRVIACVTFLLGLVLFGVLIIIVGETIVKHFFIEHSHSNSEIKSSKSLILALMCQRNWVTAERIAEIELMSEEEIKERLKLF